MVGLLGCPPRSPAVEKGYHYPSKPVELSGANKHKGNRYPSKSVELSDDNKHDKGGYRYGWSVVGLLGPLRSTAGEKGYRYPSKPVELSRDKGMTKSDIITTSQPLDCWAVQPKIRPLHSDLPPLPTLFLISSLPFSAGYAASYSLLWCRFISISTGVNPVHIPLLPRVQSCLASPLRRPLYLERLLVAKGYRYPSKPVEFVW